jgi:hypothetical protein
MNSVRHVTQFLQVHSMPPFQRQNLRDYLRRKSQRTTMENTTDNSAMVSPPNPLAAAPKTGSERPRFTRADLIAQLTPWCPNATPDEIFSRVMALGGYQEIEPGAEIYERVSFEEFLQLNSIQQVSAELMRYTRAELIAPVQAQYRNLTEEQAFERVMALGNYREVESSGLFERVSFEEFPDFNRLRRLE